MPVHVRIRPSLQLFKMEPPWIDLGEDKDPNDMDPHLIRFRIERNFDYYASSIVLPTFFSTLASFASISIPIGEDRSSSSGLTGRLSVTSTMMLAQLAFQIVVVDMMPKSGEVTYLSKYMGLAICICGLILVQNILAFYLVPEATLLLDVVTGLGGAAMWCILHWYIIRNIDAFRLDWEDMDEEDQGNLTDEWMLHDSCDWKET